MCFVILFSGVHFENPPWPEHSFISLPLRANMNLCLQFHIAVMQLVVLMFNVPYWFVFSLTLNYIDRFVVCYSGCTMMFQEQTVSMEKPQCLMFSYCPFLINEI